MKIEWLGHACFLITASDGTRIITDPYEPNHLNVISYAPVGASADIVTISHEHGDHNWLQAVSGDPSVVRGPGEHTARGISFTGVATFHDDVQGAQRGTNTIFSFVVDGIRICHLGDLGHPLNEDQVRALGSVDVLLLPVGGPRATMDIGEVNQVWHQVSPRVTIPMHFKNRCCSFPAHGVDRFTRDKTGVVRSEVSEWPLSREELSGERRIIVLPHSR